MGRKSEGGRWSKGGTSYEANQRSNKLLGDVTEKLVGTRGVRTDEQLLKDLKDVGRELTLEELTAEKKKIRQDLRDNPQERIEVDEGGFDVPEASPETEAFIDTLLGEKPKGKKVSRAELGLGIPKKKSVFKSNINIRPTRRMMLRMILGTQGGVDENGVMWGTYYILDGHFAMTPFDAAHNVPKVAFSDGKEHWWNEDGTPNWRVLNSFSNNLEDTSILPVAERAIVTTKLLKQAGYIFNLTFEDLVKMVASGDAEVKKFSGVLKTKEPAKKAA